MPPITTPIVHTERWSCGRRIRRLACTSLASARQVRCAGATDSAGCSTSTTDELHERISAPYEQPGESGQHGPIGPVHPRLGHLTPQHLDLVAQHEQLGVLGGRTPRQQHKPPQCLAEQQVQQSKGHAAIMWPDGLPDELAAQHPGSTFWHPQAPAGRRLFDS
jgi:hypothetical protein